MNPTKTQIKAALGYQFDTELADFLGITKQAVSQQPAGEPIPDAWCWSGVKKRPDVFSPSPAQGDAANAA